MNVKKLSFKSVKSSESPYSWYDVAVDGSDINILEDKDGGRDSDELSNKSTKTPEHVDIPDKTGPSGDRLEYVVLENGEFVAYDPNDNADLPAERRITLGIYFAEAGLHSHNGEMMAVSADTLLLLDFTEY